MQTRLVNLHGQDMRISHLYLTIGHIFRVIRITRTVFHNVEVCGMQYHWEIPAVFFLWAKFEYINTLFTLFTLYLFLCLETYVFSLSLNLILQRLVFFIDFIQEPLLDNCKFSLSFL